MPFTKIQYITQNRTEMTTIHIAAVKHGKLQGNKIDNTATGREANRTDK